MLYCVEESSINKWVKLNNLSFDLAEEADEKGRLAKSPESAWDNWPDSLGGSCVRSVRNRHAGQNRVETPHQRV